MSSFAPRSATMLRVFAPLIGTGMVTYLVAWAGPTQLLHNARAIGWGMISVIALAGVSHVVKTWAWRLTLLREAKKISFLRTLGLRLISEAIGQFGFVGLIFGESTRVVLLGSSVSTTGAISSVTLDRVLFMTCGAVVTIAGILAATTAVAIRDVLRLYVSLFVLVSLCLLAVIVFAVHMRWRLFSGAARTAGRLPWIREWLSNRMTVIESVEHQSLEFHRREPGAFWTSLALNFVCHFIAIAEVYLIMVLLGVRINLLGALILESLTKLINVVGAINPGNLGTYEGGNVAIGKLLGFSGTVGLTLALCRRLRAVFWAIVGGLCLAWFSKASQPALAR